MKDLDHVFGFKEKKLLIQNLQDGHLICLNQNCQILEKESTW